MKKITIRTFDQAKKEGKKLTVVTAYDYTFANLADEAGIDGLLVGDSAAMVFSGKANTLDIDLDAMVYHTRAVAKGASRAFIIADLPFMTYQASPEQALTSAGTLIKAGAEAVKLEGGAPMIETIAFLSQRGIPVCAHLGLTPQHVHQFGGFRRQGLDAQTHQQILQDAVMAAEAGARLILLEAVPAHLAQAVTAKTPCPTIGIGAGLHCDAQVLVLHDVLGLTQKPPPFAKAFAKGREIFKNALQNYKEQVQSGEFPTLEEE